MALNVFLANAFIYSLLKSLVYKCDSGLKDVGPLTISTSISGMKTFRQWHGRSVVTDRWGPSECQLWFVAPGRLNTREIFRTLNSDPNIEATRPTMTVSSVIEWKAPLFISNVISNLLRWRWTISLNPCLIPIPRHKFRIFMRRRIVVKLAVASMCSKSMSEAEKMLSTVKKPLSTNSEAFDANHSGHWGLSRRALEAIGRHHWHSPLPLLSYHRHMGLDRTLFAPQSLEVGVVTACYVWNSVHDSEFRNPNPLCRKSKTGNARRREGSRNINFKNIIDNW